MNTYELKYLINQYFDNELDKEKEILLFTQLIQNDEGREYFKKQNLLKFAAIHDIKPFPARLDKRIFCPKEEKIAAFALKATLTKKITQLLPYAAAIIFLLLALMNSQKSDSYEKTILNLTHEIEDQKLKIEYLFNTIPPIEVTPDYVQTNYQTNHKGGRK